MTRSKFLKSSLTHFMGCLLLIYFAVYLQSYLFAQFTNPWLHIDIATVVILYNCIEAPIFFALTMGFIGGILIQSLSSTPSGFFVIYFLTSIIFSNLMSKFFLLKDMSFKFLVFCLLYFLKYVLIYSSINSKNGVNFFSFIAESWQSLVVTVLSSFLLFHILHLFDTLFEDLNYSLKKKRLEKYAR